MQPRPVSSRGNAESRINKTNAGALGGNIPGRIMRIMQEEKHYSPEDAESITRQVFENVEADKGRLNRSAEYFAGLVVSAEEFEEMANNAFIEDIEQ